MGGLLELLIGNIQKSERCDRMKKIYSSSRMVRFETDKGNTVEVYSETFGGHKLWFIAGITKKKIFNYQKNFSNKKDAIASAKKLVKKYKW